VRASVHSPGVALFQDKLVSIARAVSFPRGARLVRQGETSRGAFLIRTGEVEAQVALPGGGMLTVAELGEGDMFGEMALIERGVCLASVIARSAVEGWFVARDDFRALVASRDPAALETQRGITRVLAEKLRALNARVREHPSEEDRPWRAAPPSGDPLRDVPRSALPPAWCSFFPLLPFFERFDAYEIEELTARGAALELPRGAWLFAAGSPANACFLVVRGAVEVIAKFQDLERRVALAGPGELVGYLAVLEGAPHAAAARVREPAWLLELPASEFLAEYQGNAKLQHAIHLSLLRSLARTNTQLTRLISHARLAAAEGEARKLEAALHGQLWRPQEM
jgi:CRP-like cAMP-binding protein